MLIISVPSSQGAMKKGKGLEKGPSEIIRCIPRFYLKESGVLPCLDYEEVKVAPGNISETNQAIEKTVASLDRPAIILGGDHSITYPAFKGFAKKHDSCGLIVFDAHPDCENDFSPPTHEDYLRVLIGEGHAKRENVALVGIRNSHANELEFISKHKLLVYPMKRLHATPLEDSCDALMSFARRFEALYISVDIDVVDPAYAPGTGYIEPGGMTSRELLYILQRLRLLKNFSMMDIVEVNPEKDVNGMTACLAAKLVVEMS